LLFFGIDAMGLHASANATTTQGVPICSSTG
jgi:hypothetical protein